MVPQPPRWQSPAPAPNQISGACKAPANPQKPGYREGWLGFEVVGLRSSPHCCRGGAGAGWGGVDLPEGSPNRQSHTFLQGQRTGLSQLQRSEKQEEASVHYAPGNHKVSCVLSPVFQGTSKVSASRSITSQRMQIMKLTQQNISSVSACNYFFFFSSWVFPLLGPTFQPSEP